MFLDAVKKSMKQGRSLGAVILLLSCPVQGWAQESLPEIPVQIKTHAGSTKVIFELPRLLAYHTRKTDGHLEIIFDTTAMAQLKDLSSPLIQSLQQTTDAEGVLKIDIGLQGGVHFKDYRQQRKVVIELFPQAAKAPAPPKVAAKKSAVKKTPVVTAAETPKTTAALASVPEPEAPAAPEAPESPAAPEDPNTPPPIAHTPVPPPVTTPPKTATASEMPKTVTAEPSKTIITAESSKELLAEEPTQITISALLPMRVAVFNRFNTLWIVTDEAKASASIPTLSGPLSGLLSNPKTFTFAGGMAYRYPFPQNKKIAVKKDNLRWEIILSNTPPADSAANEPHITFDAAPAKAKILTPFKGVETILTFEDPLVGDMLYVVPTALPTEKINKGLHLVDLEILPTAAGMVIRPLGDIMAVTKIDDFILISTPSGLKVTPEGLGSPTFSDPAQEGAHAEESRLFDFPNWRMGGIKKLRKNTHILEEKAAAAKSPEERTNTLMGLAVLYFANNFGQETLGILRLIQQENPDMEKNPNFIALRGAASAMAGHYKEALQDLSFPAIQNHPEVSLWIGFAAAATEQWHMANSSFPKNNRLLLEYPENISIPFTVYMAESALRLGSIETAKKLLASINTTSEDFSPQVKAAVDYLRGEAFRQEGNTAEAEALWAPVAKGLDRLYHAKASLALTALQLKQKKIPLKQAIDQLDSLRFAWRGDGLEVQILHALGKLKIQNAQYLSGLQDLKQAAKIADHLQDDSSAIRDDIRASLSDLFVGDSSKTVPPLEALSVYGEFSDMMPAGENGSIVALNFADYLIRMDLLEKATDLIEKQITAGLPPEKLPAVGTKLAAVYLLDNRAALALEALKKTEQGALPEKISAERALLKARAQSQLNLAGDAMATLGSYNSPDAKRLKADILWHAQRWDEAAAAIEALLPNTAVQKLNDSDAQLVVNTAIALRFAGNNSKLQEIKAKYEAAMTPTKLATTFGVITRHTGASDLADRDSLLKTSGEVDMFKGFLDQYKAAGKGS